VQAGRRVAGAGLCYGGKLGREVRPTHGDRRRWQSTFEGRRAFTKRLFLPEYRVNASRAGDIALVRHYIS